MPAGRAPFLARVFLPIAALVVASLAAWRAVPVSRDQLAAPFDILYETPNLRTIELVRQGRNPYAPEVYAQAPFWITLYTPLYHGVVASLPADASNPYFTGRAVGLACTLIAAAAMAWAGRASAWSALLLAGAFFLVRPVTQNAALLKNDTLGLACSMLAVLAAWRAPRSALWIATSAGLSVLALASKQSFLAAPAAILVYLCLRDRRSGLMFAGIAGGLGLAALAAARLAWGPGFTFSVYRALQNPMLWRQFSEQWSPMLRQPVFLAVCALFVVGLTCALARERRAALASSPFALYALGSFAVLLATVGKLGSNTNYFLEPGLAACAWLAWSARGHFETALRGMATCAGALVLCAASVLEVQIAQRPEYSVAGHVAKERFHESLEDLAAKIRAQPLASPRILNLVYAGLAHPLPGEILISDPFLYFLLWNSGALSSQPVAELLRNRAVDGVLVPPGLRPGAGPMPQPELFQALFAGYRPVAPYPAFEYWARKPWAGS
jgi:hypothetical protein